MKKSEELNLSKQIRSIRKFARQNNDIESFYGNVADLRVLSVQDVSFNNDIELFKEFSFILSVIFSIIAKPHLNNRREEIIARSGEAAAITEEDFLKTLRDSSIWKDDNGRMLPEYLYYHQYEDDLRIYENIFIVHMINEISHIVDHYQSLYLSLLKVVNKENFDLVLDESAQENALHIVNKLSRRLSLIKDSYFYKDVSRAKNKPKVFYPTNILVHDRLYNLVFKFYKKIYIYEDQNDINNELYAYYFCLILKYFKAHGYELDSRNKVEILDKNDFILPSKTIFTNKDLRITINLNPEEHSFIFNYKDKRDEASSNHLLIIDNDASFEDVIVPVTEEDIFTTEYLSLWHLGEASGSKVTITNQNLIGESDLIEYFINSHHYVVNGSEALYSSYCPVCKSKSLSEVNGFHYCHDCGSIYKFMRVVNEKESSKIIFAKCKGY